MPKWHEIVASGHTASESTGHQGDWDLPIGAGEGRVLADSHDLNGDVDQRLGALHSEAKVDPEQGNL